MKRRKLEPILIIKAALFILLALIFIGLIGTEIYCWVTYWNTPVEEIPGWAIFFMFR